MKGSWLVVVAFAVAVPAVAHASHDDYVYRFKHPKLTYDRLPNAVKAAVEREANGRAVGLLRQEGNGTTALYKVQLLDLSVPGQPVSHTMVVSQDGHMISGGIGGAVDHGNGNHGQWHDTPHGNMNTDRGRARDNDPDKGVKWSTESLDKDHIRA